MNVSWVLSTRLLLSLCRGDKLMMCLSRLYALLRPCTPIIGAARPSFSRPPDQYGDSCIFILFLFSLLLAPVCVIIASFLLLVIAVGFMWPAWVFSRLEASEAAETTLHLERRTRIGGAQSSTQMIKCVLCICLDCVIYCRKDHRDNYRCDGGCRFCHYYLFLLQLRLIPTFSIMILVLFVIFYLF